MTRVLAKRSTLLLSIMNMSAKSIHTDKGTPLGKCVGSSLKIDSKKSVQQEQTERLSKYEQKKVQNFCKTYLFKLF